jgi:glycosyltransferase involved in cell wall biosynthesis
MDTRTPETVAAPAAEAGRETPAPLVSVIVGVYNKERFVGECLRSVLAQTYTNWELIVVDDASTDNSLAEVERAVGRDPRVRILRRKENSGVCGVARNNGGRLAKGEILMFLDADDVWQPDKMAKQVAFMDEHPEFLFCHTACWVVDGAGKILHVRHEGCLPDSGDYVEVLLNRMWVSVSTIAVRSLLWNALGGFTEDPAWGGEEDLEFSLRCARKTQFGTIKEPLAKYRVSSENWTSKKWQGVGRDYVAYRRIYGRPELWQGVKTMRQMRTLLAEMAVEGCQYWRARGEWTKAQWFACQALRWLPFSTTTWRQMGGVLLKRR